MKIAILGSRGIPACYGGYETLVEELSLGLVAKRSAEVLVYCRSSYFNNRPDYYRGVRLIYLPSIPLKAIESIFHSFLSSVHAIFQNVDIVFFVDPANAPFFILLRLFGKKVVVHTDGLGWKRRKWGRLARSYYEFVELLCKWTANVLVTDNPAMTEYYKKKYNADSVYITYGASNDYGEDEAVYKELGITPKKYLLVVARLEPENNTRLIVDEYVRSVVEMPLVVVGDSPYSVVFMDELRGAAANGNVRFVGRINDQRKLSSIYKGAYLYIHGHEVGGTNPSLLRAMDKGAVPIVMDVAFNKLVIADCGYVFKKESGSLSSILIKLAAESDKIDRLGLIVKERADKYFRWDDVIRRYEDTFTLLGRRFP